MHNQFIGMDGKELLYVEGGAPSGTGTVLVSGLVMNPVTVIQLAAYGIKTLCKHS